MKIRITAAGLLLLACGCLQASPATGLAMLEPMVGEWQGGGWMLHEGRRHAFSSRESVRRVMGGHGLLIEGSHHVEREGKRIPVHQALAVIQDGHEPGSFRMQTFLAGREGVSAEAEWEAGVFTWGFAVPGGEIRYRIDFRGGGWLETGERRQEGGDWQTFFRMRLARVE